MTPKKLQEASYTWVWDLTEASYAGDRMSEKQVTQGIGFTVINLHGRYTHELETLKGYKLQSSRFYKSDNQHWNDMF